MFIENHFGIVQETRSESTRSELQDDSVSFHRLQIKPETAEKRQLNHGRNVYSEYP
jgi:hypothetical protein